MANGVFDEMTRDYRAAGPYGQGVISAALAGGRPDPQIDLIRQILHGIRGRKAMPEAEAGPADALAGTIGPPLPPGMDAMGAAPPMADRGPLDEEGGFSGGRLRFPEQSAVTGMMPGLGEMPAPPRDSGPPFLRGAPLPGGMDDTRFRGPRGEQAPDVDLGGAVLPAGGWGSPGGRTEPIAAEETEMDPDRRIALLGAARNLAKAGSQFANITGPAGIELEAQGRRRRDFSIDTSGVDAEEERIRRGDFENPGSPASQMARQMLSQLTGQEPPEGMSASAIMGISPVFDKLIRAQYAGFGQQLALEREARAQRGEERHVAERGEDIRRGREKELRGAFATERKDWLSPTGQIGKYREGIEMTDKALALLEQGGAQAFGTALSLIIKGIGKEAGNIAQKEREVLLGEIGIPGLVTKGIKAWTGDYTPEQYEAMKNVAKKARELIDRDRGVYQSQRMDSFYKTHRELLDESGIGMDELQGRLGVDTAGSGMNAQQSAAPPAGPAGTGQGGVSVIGKDGKVHGPFPRAQAEHYLSTGEATHIYEE